MSRRTRAASDLQLCEADVDSASQARRVPAAPPGLPRPGGHRAERPSTSDAERRAEQLRELRAGGRDGLAGRRPAPQRLGPACELPQRRPSPARAPCGPLSRPPQFGGRRQLCDLGARRLDRLPGRGDLLGQGGAPRARSSTARSASSLSSSTRLPDMAAPADGRPLRPREVCPCARVTPAGRPSISSGEGPSGGRSSAARSASAFLSSGSAALMSAGSGRSQDPARAAPRPAPRCARDARARRRAAGDPPIASVSSSACRALHVEPRGAHVGRTRRREELSRRSLRRRGHRDGVLPRAPPASHGGPPADRWSASAAARAGPSQGRSAPLDGAGCRTAVVEPGHRLAGGDQVARANQELSTRDRSCAGTRRLQEPRRTRTTTPIPTPRRSHRSAQASRSGPDAFAWIIRPTPPTETTMSPCCRCGGGHVLRSRGAALEAPDAEADPERNESRQREGPSAPQSYRVITGRLLSRLQESWMRADETKRARYRRRPWRKALGLLANRRYSEGTTNRLSSVDVTRPPRITTAIGCSISWPGMLPGDHQRHQRQPGGQRGHQDRRQPFARAAQHQPGPNVSPSYSLEVLEVVDHQDAVAGGDPEAR